MSWAEVMKVNSDMQEPLNYSHYISDIAVFGAQSFVMSPENAGLWNEMALKSRRLYGHRAIHNYVYDRLTEENIDALFEQSGILGDLLNAFHQTEQYRSGGIDEFLRGMTLKSCQELSEKFRKGYQRHVEKKMTGPGIGRWLNQVFQLNSPVLECAGSWLEILEDVELINLLLPCEAAMTAVTSSKGAMDTLIAHPDAVTLISEQIAIFAENEMVWRSAVNNHELMAAVFQNPDAFAVVAGSEPAMGAILRSEPAMLAMMDTPEALETLARNQTAMDSVVNAATEISKASTALEQVQSCMQKINQELPDITGADTITESMTAAEAAITISLETLRPVVLAAVTNAEMMRLLFQNQVAMKAIVESPAAMNTIGGCPEAIEMAITCPVAMAKIRANEMAVTKFVLGQVGVDCRDFDNISAITGNLAQLRVVAANDSAMVTVSESELVMAAFSKVASVRTTLPGYVQALHKILKSPYRTLLFENADFRNAVHNNRTKLNDKKYFSSTEKTGPSLRCDTDAPILVQPETAKIYLAKKVYVFDAAAQDEGGTNVVHFYDYDISTRRMGNVSVTASYKNTQDLNLTQFVSIKPIFQRASFTGRYPGEVAMNLIYIEYTAI